MMSMDIYQARRTVAKEKEAGTLINACGKTAAKTAIILDNGAVIKSPLSIAVLMNALEKSNIKASARNSARLKVYDVYDEEPSPDIDEEVDEISASDDDDYDDDFDE